MVVSIPLDANRQQMIAGTLDTDGQTVVPIYANPSTHAIKTASATTGSSFTSTTAQRDANRKTVIWGVSSADGITPIYIAVNSSGEVLIDIT